MTGYAYAMRLVDRLEKLLADHCERMAVVGGLRRKRNEVDGIEMVLVPKKVTVKTDLFTTKEIIDPHFVRLMNGAQWIFVSGNPANKSRANHVCVRQAADGTILKFYLVEPEHFGIAMVMKTGPFTFNQLIAQKVSRKRWKLEKGKVVVKKTGHALPFPEEQLLFEALKMKWIEPEDRWRHLPKDNSKWTTTKPSPSNNSPTSGLSN